MSDDHTAGGLRPRWDCPKCGGSVDHASRDPLEEYCISPDCDYYRAEAAGGVVRE